MHPVPGPRSPVPASSLLRLSRLVPLALLAAACGGTERSASTSAGPLIVFNAGSLARPLRAALDTFALREGVAVEQESAGSLETARKLTELGSVPDIVGLADAEVFPQLLVPEHVAWYARFARNRMVVAYTPRSRGADSIATGNWHRVLADPSVEVGRADPDLDPNGYRTLLVLQLAERYYGEPGLAGRLLANAPERNVRPKEADLVGLLQAGELDYIWSYESLAQATGLRYVTLPDSIDLGTAADSAFYRTASIRVAGSGVGDTVTFRGEPIVYGIAIPRQAPHPELAVRFLAFLFSDDGRRVLRAARLDALDAPTIVGEGAPDTLRALAGR
jgi:molybdate/tungstate transport system substrate-binding protein